MRVLNSFCFSILLLILSGCGQLFGQDPREKIYGEWKAESVRLGSVGIPVGPHFLLEKDSLTFLESGTQLPLKAINIKGSEVTLEFSGPMPDVTFVQDGDNRIYFDALLTKIYYSKIAALPKKNVDGASVPSVGLANKPAEGIAPSVGEKAPPTVSSNDSAIVKEPTTTVLPRDVLLDLIAKKPADPAVAFSLARSFAKEGDEESLRYLAQAFRSGLDSVQFESHRSEFSRFFQDPRYLAVVHAYGSANR